MTRETDADEPMMLGSDDEFDDVYLEDLEDEDDEDNRDCYSPPPNDIPGSNTPSIVHQTQAPPPPPPLPMALAHTPPLLMVHPAQPQTPPFLVLDTDISQCATIQLTSGSKGCHS